MRFDKLCIGVSVCDMHDGLPDKIGDQSIEVGSHIRIPVDGSEPFQALLKAVGAERGTYSNKIAVVVAAYDGRWWTAAYSYDARSFGIFQFRKA